MILKYLSNDHNLKLAINTCLEHMELYGTILPMLSLSNIIIVVPFAPFLTVAHFDY
jgi:hypothetical protein